MESQSPLSSPKRGAIKCTVTYLARKKSKPTISNSRSESESNSTSRSVVGVMKALESPGASQKLNEKVPASNHSMEIDVPIPGPSAEKSRGSYDEGALNFCIKEASREHVDLSVSSLRQASQGDSVSWNKKSETSLGSLCKPQSKALNTASEVSENDFHSPGSSSRKEPALVLARELKSQEKSVAADDDFDDSISVPDSFISIAKIRRNEGERMEYFKNQSDCGQVEPHSAECRRCGKLVSLGRKQTYAVRPWEIHRARCDLKPALVISSSRPSLEAEEICGFPLHPLSSIKPLHARRPTDGERKEFLEADEQIQDLKEHRALCRKCQTWITLSKTHGYATGNWIKHKAECSDVVPSNRVAAAKRRLLLVNDEQVKIFAVRWVECCFCGITIRLEGKGDYNLTKWDEHKSQCTKTVPFLGSNIMNSVPFPSPFPVPASWVSTEGTVVADTANFPLSQGMKRSRIEPEAALEEDARPSSRQRRQSYLPAQIEPPNTAMGWFMLPFHSFVRGFKESLKERP